jgi:YadA-like membrane anchor domain
MKGILKATAVMAVMGVTANHAAAQFTDTVTYPTSQYVAVDGSNNPITAPAGLINSNGTFTAACVGCSWVSGTPVSGQATYNTLGISSANNVTGNSATVNADGASFQNGTSVTSVAPTGVTTNGTVTANSVVANSVSATVLSTQDSHGYFYANVGDALTADRTGIAANSAAISSLQNLYAVQQGQINNLNARMDKAYGGIAMATAFEVPQVDPGKHFGFSVNYADFAGYSGFSGVGKLRFDDHWSMTGGVAGSSNGQFAGKVGFQTQW